MRGQKGEQRSISYAKDKNTDRRTSAFVPASVVNQLVGNINSVSIENSSDHSVFLPDHHDREYEL